MSSTQVATWSNNWMSGIADDTNIAGISIPGTHESCSRFQVGDAQCQWFSIIQQLNRGIRFLDIRCNYETGSETGLTQHIYFPVYHGIARQNILFEEIQAQCVAFLDANPSEFILMNIQMNEGTEDRAIGAQFGSKFLDLIEPYKDYWYMETGVKIQPGFGPVPNLPTIHDVRKRIVLVRSIAIMNSNSIVGWEIPSGESNRSKGGFTWSGFNINGTSSEINSRTQNKWDDTDYAEKQPMVEQYIKDAKDNANFGMLTFNFASYTGYPGANAQEMNDWMKGYLKTNWGFNTGIIALDFTGNTGDAGDSLENLIIEHQPHQKPGYVYGGIPEWLLKISA